MSEDEVMWSARGSDGDDESEEGKGKGKGRMPKRGEGSGELLGYFNGEPFFDPA